MERAGVNNSGNVKWRCKCECGNEAVVVGPNLTRGTTRSCGCLAHDNRSPKFVTHGQSNTRLYRTWVSMKERCYREKYPKYRLYGGRGIRVCQEWQTFEKFAEWAKANGYQEDSPRSEMTLDRIDPDGDYEPSNCRWASYTEQNRNKRTNRLITYNGQTKTAAEWGYEIGGDRHSILRRLELGWTIERAITEPLRRSNNG